MFLDEYGFSFGDLRVFCSYWSNTSEFIVEIFSVRDGSGGELYGYMIMDRFLSYCGRFYRRVLGDGV